MKEKIIKELEALECTSAWRGGVRDYAIMMLENIDELDITKKVKAQLLNGARDWGDYSYGGFALIYDCDIAKTLCNASELKKTKNGELAPNGVENWLDVQARALMQAYILIVKIVDKIKRM